MFQRMRLLIMLSIIAVASCKTHDDITVHRGFYFWKSRLVLSSNEQNALHQLKIEKLYIRFFDVTWDELRKAPAPVAKIDFVQKIPAGIEPIPVVFITNETLQHAGADDIAGLGLNIPKLIASILSNNQLASPNEIQIDCDWTESTKDKYFLLLKQLRKSTLFQNKTLSVTIRLHQLKYRHESGIPPADRGLLMCYNMGNLQRPETKNSIMDDEVLKQYIGHANDYSLPLDIALPLFDWWVWFNGNNYKGLIHANEISLPADANKRWYCTKDTTINGFTFRAGDWLRYENSTWEANRKAIAMLKDKLNIHELNLLLYHLDSTTLSHYETAQLENMYNGFHR
jgi:hypothetical protein